MWIPLSGALSCKLVAALASVNSALLPLNSVRLLDFVLVSPPVLPPGNYLQQQVRAIIGLISFVSLFA